MTTELLYAMLVGIPPTTPAPEIAGTELGPNTGQEDTPPITTETINQGLNIGLVLVRMLLAHKL